MSKCARRTSRNGTAGDIGDEAAASVLGPNPFVGLDARATGSSALRWLSALAANPSAIVGPAVGASAELGKIAIGRSSVAPEKGDRRLEDPARKEHPAFT